MVTKTDIVVVGGGPIGIFTIFEAGMLDMTCCLIESQESLGGQCKYLYPEKPIYDIPAYPMITAEDLIEKLCKQAQPFKPNYKLGRSVTKVEKNEGNRFNITLDNGEIIECLAVVIAGGCGSFQPNKPIVSNIEQFEGKSVNYAVEEKSHFIGKKVVIAGGGDSAVDWALLLADVVQKLYVVHRRDKFSCHPKSQSDLYGLAQKGKVEMVIPYQLSAVRGDGDNLKEVVVNTLSADDAKVLPADELLIFFGLRNSLGPILEWGLNIENKRIIVQQRSCRTNISGVYAVGDIADYQGKLKLILTGFAEVAAACHDIRQSVFVDKAFNFEYSTNKGVN